MDKKTEPHFGRIVVDLIVLALLLFIVVNLIHKNKVGNVVATESTMATAVEATEAVCMFETIEKHYNYEIVYDIETGVMYVVSLGSNNKGTFTMLVNADGSPRVYKK